MSDKVQGWAWDLDLQPARKLVLLWLAGRATDNGVAFPGEREIRERTGLGERMVRYHLQWLASDRDDTGQPKRPLVIRVERRISSQRNTSNVYILAVPWQEPNAVRRDLEELQHVTKAAIELALTVLRQAGAMDCPQRGKPVAPRWGQPVAGRNRHQGNVTGIPPNPPRGHSSRGRTGEPSTSVQRYPQHLPQVATLRPRHSSPPSTTAWVYRWMPRRRRSVAAS